VSTRALGRLAWGSSITAAGLKSISRCLIAEFSADRNVARIRCLVAGPHQSPSLTLARMAGSPVRRRGRCR
jgi:hypothetical protein